MKTYSLIKKSLVITFASIILACGAETLVALVFIPAFAAQWEVVGEESYKFSFNNDNSGEALGVFDGSENNFPDDSDGFSNDLTGSFNGLNIEFTVERLSNNSQDTTFVQFNGTMTPTSNENHNITSINLNSTGVELVLVRD